MSASSFDLLDRLAARDLSPRHLELSLSDIGLMAGDVFAVGSTEERGNYEI